MKMCQILQIFAKICKIFEKFSKKARIKAKARTKVKTKVEAKAKHTSAVDEKTPFLTDFIRFGHGFSEIFKKTHRKTLQIFKTFW